MPHEIYYTSASQGLRQGQRGFCTVAATDGIPRPLWDRLEAVSGYRHHFTGPAATQDNPVGWAHWLMQIQGREVSVLSRVCDAGLDYTQRTNAFAHHVALEPTERAAAGPAWMLARPGVMETRWNGAVGPIVRSSPLPAGDAYPTICHAWQRATGDAGWAGVLAESGMKSPRKPVCILFPVGLDLLPLVSEAIALLPAGKRWDVSFNTYFTGLPGNVTCAWRCCLAGTPAAADAVRHAAGGLVIDLSRPETLGVAPAGEWTEMARSGRGAATDITPSAKSGWTRPKPTKPPSLPKKPGQSPPPVPEEDLPEIFETVEAPPTAKLPPAPRAAPAVVGAARGVDTSWSERQRRSRMKLFIALAALAIVFVGIGVWLRMAAQQATTVAPTTQPTTAPAEPEVVISQDLLNPIVPSVPTPTPVAPTPTTRQAVVVEPTPVVPTPTPTPEPVAPVPPPLIVLSTQLTLPVAVGLRDPVQSLSFPTDTTESLRTAAELKVMFPEHARVYTLKSAGGLSGTLSVDPAPRQPMKVLLTWRDEGSVGKVFDVASLALELPKGNSPARLEVSWKNSTLVSRPELTAVAMAVLQQSELVIADARPIFPRVVNFKPAPPIAIDIAPVNAAISMPAVPAGATVREVRDLPDGWRLTWGRDISGKVTDPIWNAATFERPLPSGKTATFAVRFSPEWNNLTSTWAAQRQEAVNAVLRAQADLAKAESELGKLMEQADWQLKNPKEELRVAEEEAKLSEAELEKKFTNKKDAKARLERARKALEITRGRVEPDVQAAKAKRDAAEAAKQSADAAASAFDKLKNAELAVELPEKLRVATLLITIGKP